VILGTKSGQIFEMAVDEADKREKYVKPLFEPTEQREGIKDLKVFRYCGLLLLNRFFCFHWNGID
jgi:hypothetical protein